MDSSMEVTLEDQKRINAFSRLNARMHDYEAQLKAKQKLMEDLEDAENELMLSDDDVIKMAVGECFVHMDKDAAEERLGATTTETQADIDEIKKHVTGIQEQLSELRTQLYGKFKDTINLEE